MTFDIPINFKLHADSEKEAELKLSQLLQGVMRSDGNDVGIIDWEFFEFIPHDIA